METGQEKIRILVVEDNGNYAELLKEMLAEDPAHAFLATFADTISSALACLAKRDFDIVLLDLRLPDSEGCSACERIRAAVPALPVVIVSATPEEEGFADECLDRGVQDYLTKGNFDHKLLIHSLRYAMQRKKIETEYQKAQRALVEANQALVQKVRELDRLNTTMMGREERILELKEELRALKAAHPADDEKVSIQEAP